MYAHTLNCIIKIQFVINFPERKMKKNSDKIKKIARKSLCHACKFTFSMINVQAIFSMIFSEYDVTAIFTHRDHASLHYTLFKMLFFIKLRMF